MPIAETPQDYITRILGFLGSREPLEVLGSTARRLAELVGSRPESELRWSPSPDRWSSAAIVAHLADAEIVAAYRVRQILSSPGIEIQAFDQNKWADAMRYRDADAFAALSLFTSLRTNWLRLVTSAPDGWLDRYGMHQERGKETVRHLLRLYAGHDLNHLQQVERLLGEVDTRTPARAKAFEPHAAKPIVSKAALEPLDIRVGTIRAVEELPGSQRLMRLRVSVGAGQMRTVVAGIKQERHRPADLVGRQALFVVNVEPKAIHGERSDAMLFDIGFEDGLRPALATTEWPMPDGARAG
jgi:tRNA-binding EMAP/Myf-like protein